jgi:hypothetical protein
MKKLGYTWYPKDWGNSEKVFELNLSERGLYREFIDLAMMSDNKTEIKINLWSRKFNCSEQDINDILNRLSTLQLIVLKQDNTVFVPSCESRLNLCRGGSIGGKNKPTPKPMVKPTPKPMVKPTPKPMVKQIEIEREIEKEIPPTPLTNKNDFYESDKAFLIDFNKARKHYIKLDTEIVTLTAMEKMSFREIQHTLTIEEIRTALQGMFEQKELYEHSKIRPTHFLKNVELYRDAKRGKLQLFETKQKKSDRL